MHYCLHLDRWLRRGCMQKWSVGDMHHLLIAALCSTKGLHMAYMLHIVLLHIHVCRVWCRLSSWKPVNIQLVGQERIKGAAAADFKDFGAHKPILPADHFGEICFVCPVHPGVTLLPCGMQPSAISCVLGPATCSYMQAPEIASLNCFFKLSVMRTGCALAWQSRGRIQPGRIQSTARA